MGTYMLVRGALLATVVTHELDMHSQDFWEGYITVHSECKARFHLGTLRQSPSMVQGHPTVSGLGGKVPNRKPAVW